MVKREEKTTKYNIPDVENNNITNVKITYRAYICTSRQNVTTYIIVCVCWGGGSMVKCDDYYEPW